MSFKKKGNGRSLMLSYFMVQHESGDIFFLDEEEWKEAVAAYPELDDDDENKAKSDKPEFLNFLPRSANAWIEPGKDSYFNNCIILHQFERLFKLTKFKKAFKENKIEILVENTRTHSAKVYDVNLFNKKPSTNCIYKSIELVEESAQKRYNYFSSHLIL
jgi:hypothetical protein